MNEHADDSIASLDDISRQIVNLPFSTLYFHSNLQTSNRDSRKWVRLDKEAVVFLSRTYLQEYIIYRI